MSIDYTRLFVCYYFISTILSLLYTYYLLNFSDKKDVVEDEVRSIVWETGVKRENIILLLYLLDFFLGVLIVPYEIVSHIKDLFEKGNN